MRIDREHSDQKAKTRRLSLRMEISQTAFISHNLWGFRIAIRKKSLHCATKLRCGQNVNRKKAKTSEKANSIHTRST